MSLIYTHVINLAMVIQLSTTLSSLDYHKLYTNKCTMKYKRVVERYTAVASDPYMNTNEYQGDNQDTMIYPEVHLLAGKLVPLMAIHSFGGSRAKWHHTLNPQ